MITTKTQVLFLTFLLVPSQTLWGGLALRPLDQQTVGEVSQEKVLDIISRAKTPRADIYTPAFEELKKVGPDRLIELSRSTEVEVRVAAAEGLGIIGPMNARVIPTLIGLATEGNQKVRSVAIRALGAAGQSSSAKIKRSSTNKARSGFYLEIKRSYVRAYPGWQKNTIALLRPKGFEAFNGDPKNNDIADNIRNLESIEKTAKPTLIVSSVYVGPHRSREQAEHRIPKLLSALKPLIDREKKNDELHNRSLFLVGVVRVI